MASSDRRQVVVYLDAAELGPRRPAGVLQAGSAPRPAISFAYARSWLEARDSFALDPSLPLIEGEQFARDGSLAGIFMDTAPDRWGRRLLERREAFEARRESRRARTLDDWDFLLGVSDGVRMGALRLAEPENGRFLDDARLAVPPPARLRELEHAAKELETSDTVGDPDEESWLSLLLAAGSSLGGARPKANYLAEDGGLWIAKFPSRSDRRDVGAWEYVLTRLAERADIAVPEVRLLRLGAEYRTFAARRFDRVGDGRRLYASAMTLVGRRDGEEASYLDIALAVADYVAAAAIDADLEQLFRRVVFNVLVGNRDDHLRNHGFLRAPQGWRLAPAFDLNPAPEKPEHTLAIDDALRVPDISLVLETAPFYRLSAACASQIVDETRHVVAGWQVVARDDAGIPAAEVDALAGAFENS